MVKRQKKSDGDEGRKVGNEKRKRECRLNGEWRKAAGLWERRVGQWRDGSACLSNGRVMDGGRIAAIPSSLSLRPDSVVHQALCKHRVRVV